ncbi:MULTISPECIES: DNA gyrase subunit B [Campylobacter]|uniref:COG4648 family protein n=1 Tax=Campylobacter TaxID=194 RepID=UPI00146FE126|nr:MULTISPECIES: DNA gyrase subunit B [Campylobacter]MBN7287371.1 DNA gyrase subunit B [Campylobacter curvus]MDU6826717.1 DNA gyrase subunit B [Campylobacter sp.]
MKLKIAKFTLTLVSVIYPFVLLFASEHSGGILLLLAVLWAVRGYFESGDMKRVCWLAAAFFVLCAIFRGGFLAFLYPSLVSLAFLVFFANSLKGEAVITRLARLKEPDLDEKGVIYTRNLTKIWCAFFIFNAASSFFLALFEDKIYWSVYSGFVSYVLMAALFGGEILYRKFFILRDEK